jgi:anti-anti-sigma factor
MPGKPAGTPAIVALPVEIDLTNHAVAAASLLDALDNLGLVIADMTGTTFCDSAGLRMLLNAHQHASASGSTLRIVIRPGSPVARSLAILGTDRMLPIYASLEDAVRAQFGTSQPTRQASGQPDRPVP